MNTKTKTASGTESQVTVEDVNRLLEVGRLLFSVLTPEEIEQLQKHLSTPKQIGNAGDS